VNEREYGRCILYSYLKIEFEIMALKDCVIRDYDWYHILDH
jgi:hypothetical protein